MDYGHFKENPFFSAAVFHHMLSDWTHNDNKWFRFLSHRIVDISQESAQQQKKRKKDGRNVTELNGKAMWKWSHLKQTTVGKHQTDFAIIIIIEP